MNIWTFYFQIVHNRGHEVFNDEWTFGLCQWAVAQIVFPPLVRNSGMCGCGLKSNWACMNLMNYKKKKDWKDCQLCLEVVIMLKFAVFERL